MTRKRMFVVAAVVLVSTVLGLYAYSKNVSVPVSFTTATVARGDVVATVGATGTVEAVSTVQVGTQVTGTIWKLYADFNSRVQKNQVVARLEPSLFDSRLTEAKANLASAEANRERARVGLEDTRRKLVRAKELAAQALLPQSDLDAAQLAFQSAEAQLSSAVAQIEQARAAVDQATVNLDHTVIRSPINGVVIARNVDVGQTVAASLQAPTLFTVAEDLAQMRVVANVDEADVGTLALGQRATFRVDAFPEDTFAGSVSQVRLAPIVLQNVVTYNALVDVDNRDLKLRPGMTANVTFEVAHHANVLRVPNAALRYRPSPELLASSPGGESAEGPGPRSLGEGGPQAPDAPGDRSHGKAAGGQMPGGRPRGGDSRHPGVAGVAGVAGAAPSRAGGPSGRPAGAGRNTVFVVQSDGKLRPLSVRTGLTDGTYTEIERGGVNEGDVVATGSGDAARGGSGQAGGAGGAGGPPSPMRFMGFGRR